MIILRVNRIHFVHPILIYIAESQCIDIIDKCRYIGIVDVQ